MRVEEPTHEGESHTPTTSQVSTPTQVIIHSIEKDSHQEEEEYDDEGLNTEVPRQEGDQQYVILSSLSSFDDVPTSNIESSILDFTKSMEQVIA